MDNSTKRLLQRLLAAGISAAIIYMIVQWTADHSVAAAACAVLAAMVVLAVGYDAQVRDLASALEREHGQIADLQARLAHDEVRQIIEAIDEPILIIEQDLKIHWTNRMARSLLGGNIEGEALPLFLRQPGAMEAIRSVMLSGDPAEREVQFLSPIDATYTLAVRPLGQEGRILVWMRDVTKSRLTERMRVDFVANASHELRTPLATLIGFIETLQGAAAKDEAARTRFLGIMADEAARMARLIDDLLSLSRIEMDKHVRPSTQIDVPPLLKQVEQTLAVRLEADSRRIELRMPSALPKVIADRDQVLQVVHNLVANAIKYGRSGTPITVEAEAIEKPLGGQLPHVRIAVMDEGDGIAPEHLPRLTERFYRVDTARSRKLGGTGLGLSIVKHIVEKHRGELSIDSRLGVGTTVAFTLPIASPQALAVMP